MASKLWTEEEINFLKENWSTKTHKEIAKELNRSISSIANKTRKLRLVDNSSKWTDEEVEFLKENYFKDVNFLADKLNKTCDAVKSKRFKLGLAVSNKWSKEEEQFLIENWNKDEDFLVKHLSRNINSIRQKGYRMGLCVGRFWTKEDDAYLKEKWGTVKIESICKYLNRSKRAVENRAYTTLGLSSQIAWYSTKEIAEMLGVNKCTIRKRIIKSNFPHHKSKTKQKVYMLDEVQLKRFLKENQDLWHYDNLTINIFENEMLWLKAKKEADRNKLKKFKKSWSEEEDFRMLDMLRNNYTYEEVAKKLNRTVEGCKGRHRYKYRWKL